MIRLLYVGLTENTVMRGVERYALELLRALVQRCGDRLAVTLLCGGWQTYFRELEPLGVELRVASCRRGKAARHLFLATRMRPLSRDFDVVHYGNLMPLFIPNRAPSTMTIHDVAEYVIAGKYSAVQRAYRRVVAAVSTRLASRILADSEFTATEIGRHLGVPKERVTVIYPGVDHFHALDDDGSTPGSGTVLASGATLAPAGRYFVYYGVLEETKGVDTAILAFRQLTADAGLQDVRLVLIGRPGNAYERIRPWIDGERVVHLGHVDDASLQRWLRRAVAIVFVSRYEGFGFPAVEGYLLNDRVIASRGNSLGEVTRGFAHQVDEHSVDAVAEAMRGALAGRLPAPLLSREDVLARFSWAKAARQFAEVVEAIVPVPQAAEAGR